MTQIEQPLAKAAQACQRGEWKKAKQLFLHALRVDHNRIGALHGLGVVCLHYQQPARASVLLERGLALLEHTDEDPRPLKSALVFALNTAASEAASGGLEQLSSTSDP